MASGTFYVWVSVLSERASDSLVSALVRRGFSVECLAASNSLTQQGEVASLCAMKITADHLPDPVPATTPPAPPATQPPDPQHFMMTHVKESLAGNHDSYYAIIVQHVGGNCIKMLPPEVKPAGPSDPTKPTVLDKVDAALGG